MYLHLGRDTVVRYDELVGIFNMETATISAHTREFLARAEKSGQVVNVCEEKLPASFAVSAAVTAGAASAGKNVYIAQISSATLKKRILESGI